MCGWSVSLGNAGGNDIVPGDAEKADGISWGGHKARGCVCFAKLPSCCLIFSAGSFDGRCWTNILSTSYWQLCVGCEIFFIVFKGRHVAHLKFCRAPKEIQQRVSCCFQHLSGWFHKVSSLFSCLIFRIGVQSSVLSEGFSKQNHHRFGFVDFWISGDNNNSLFTLHVRLALRLKGGVLGQRLSGELICIQKGKEQTKWVTLIQSTIPFRTLIITTMGFTFSSCDFWLEFF